MRLELLSGRMEKALYGFELQNRHYFEQSVPSRGEKFYHWPFFQEGFRELLKEQRDGLCYMHIIMNGKGEIIGRMNLTNVNHDMGIAELGYRMGKAFAGKGYASKALSLLVNETVETYGLHQIKAKTVHDNVASQRVLQKNGFQLTTVEKGKAEWKGIKKDFWHFVWNAPAIIKTDGE